MISGRRSELVNIDLETMDIEAVVEDLVVKMIERYKERMGKNQGTKYKNSHI